MSTHSRKQKSIGGSYLALRQMFLCQQLMCCVQNTVSAKRNTPYMRSQEFVFSPINILTV